MDSEVNEVWGAMKHAKYRNTLSELNNVKRQDFDTLSLYLSRVLNIVADAVHAETGTLWFYDKFDDGRIYPKASSGSDSLKDFSLSFGEGIAGHVIQSGQGILIEDCRKSTIWSKKADNSTGFHTDTMMCSPVFDNNECFGCIQLINRTDNELFDNKDMEFLNMLSSEVSRIIRECSDKCSHGCFDAFNSERYMDFNMLFDSQNPDELSRGIKMMIERRSFNNIQSVQFERSCKTIWKLLRKADLR